MTLTEHGFLIRWWEIVCFHIFRSHHENWEEESREESFPFKYIATASLWSDTQPLPICFLAVFCPHCLSSSSCIDLLLAWVPSPQNSLNKFIDSLLSSKPQTRVTPNDYHIGGSPFLGLGPCGLPSAELPTQPIPVSYWRTDKNLHLSDVLSQILCPKLSCLQLPTTKAV